MGRGEAVTYVDKTGRAFEVVEIGENAQSELRAMYDGFTQQAITQGLPPAVESERHKWVRTLLDLGVNFVATQEGEIVGHSVLIPIEERGDAEYVIFVSEGFRSRGLGTALTKEAIGKARSMGISSVWLTVESFNFRAIKLYRKVGFEFYDKGERERTMGLKL